MAVPKLRFKGFEGEWKPIKAEAIFVTSNERNRPELPVLSAFQDNRGMAIREENGYNIAHDKRNEITYKHVMPGQFVMHLRSFQGGFAHAAIEGITSPAYTVFGFAEKKDNHDYFWKQIFMSSAFIKRLETITYGIRDGRSISFDEFLKLSFNVPKKAEQIDISEFILKINKILDEQTITLVKLKQAKAGAMVAMFPQKGETAPRVRFKGFDEPWKSFKFGELYERRIEKNDMSYGVDKIISVANIYYIQDGRVSDEDYLRTYNVFRLGDIAFEGHTSKDFLYGRFVANIIGDGIVSHIFVVLKPKNPNSELSFWRVYINNENQMKEILGRCTKASTMMNDIVVDEFFRETILVPSLTEQQKIGAFFRNLDRQIEAQTQILERLKRVKAACLDLMFV